jgi:hypothetical protein
VKCTTVFLALTLSAPMTSTVAVVSDEPDDSYLSPPLGTRSGVIDLVHVPDISSNDTLTVGERKVFDAGMEGILLKKLFQLSTGDVLLFETMCRCSNGEPIQMFLLVLKPKRKPAVIRLGGISTDGGSAWQEGDRVFVKIGIVDGKERTVELVDGKAVVHKKSAAHMPVKDADCKLVYLQILAGECTDKRLCAAGSVGWSSTTFFARANWSLLREVAGYPTFNERAFFDMCSSTCKTGDVETYPVFSKAVCGSR